MIYYGLSYLIVLLIEGIDLNKAEMTADRLRFVCLKTSQNLKETEVKQNRKFTNCLYFIQYSRPDS